VVIFPDSSDIAPDLGIWVPATIDTVNGRGLIVETPESIVGLMVDPRGTVLGIQYPLGVTWVREEFNIARFNFRGRLDDSSDVLRQALPVLARQPGPIATGDSMARWRVTRRDGSLAHIEMLAGGRQDTSQGYLVVGAPLANTVRLGRTEPGDPLIQSTDSLVAAFAASIAPPNDRRGLERVAQTVAARVTLDTARSAAADAAGALRTGRALPEGLSRLMVAVLRHHGWRGRVAFGVRPAGDTLYTHAWVETFHPQRQIWRAIDPATGRTMPADWIRVAWAGSTLPELMLPIVADARFTPAARAAGQGGPP
jgi:hypothetical protein